MQPPLLCSKTGVYLFFLFLIQNIDCGYSLEPPRRGGSNVYPQSMFWAKNENIKNVLLKFSNFTAGKNLYIIEFLLFSYYDWTCELFFKTTH